jgi:antitoxin ParD1/3/4
MDWKPTEGLSMSMSALPPNSLPPELATFVADQLSQGKYDSAEEVVCEAVRLLREREERLVSLRADIEQGIAQLESGEYIELGSEADVDKFFDDVLARAANRAT